MGKIISKCTSWTSTSFTMEHVIFCYRVISFGLYQKMVSKVLASQLGRNMAVCVDEILVNSHIAP